MGTGRRREERGGRLSPIRARGGVRAADRTRGSRGGQFKAIDCFAFNGFELALMGTGRRREV